MKWCMCSSVLKNCLLRKLIWCILKVPYHFRVIISFSLLLVLLDASSLCLNCSQRHMILFPPQWLMMPLKFIFMLNLVMIFWGPQLFTDGSYPLTDWSLGAIFRRFLWNCTRRQKATFPAPRPRLLIIGDCELEFYPIFNAGRRQECEAGQVRY